MKLLLLVIAVCAVTGTYARSADPALSRSPRTCNEGNFKCDNGLCIPEAFVCDGVYDCITGNDEANCDSQSSADPALSANPRTCNEGNFKCDNGLCIPEAFVCDGVYDCITGNDEANCDAKDQLTNRRPPQH